MELIGFFIKPFVLVILIDPVNQSKIFFLPKKIGVLVCLHARQAVVVPIVKILNYLAVLRLLHLILVLALGQHHQWRKFT